ncbi:antigenic heat-stable protein [Thalictrum thalictroides]|uniref:Antigenic heat-stable protein n=1 Tax=Thalictrum thalictroides TaxID=46969 RepID=A0A7J6VGI8_THATH|nr:antigenic heat-stable protein [Thalictrum thalictroides]
MESHVTKLISAEEVISKLKDDGDFDKLRLKIIKKVKENEELRNNIIATVKQSAALNRAGAEKFKPRELSDAIHEEIGDNVLGQVSDALWGVIRSNDGMKGEISETVESVYNTLLNPIKVQGSSTTTQPVPGDNEVSNIHSFAESVLPHDELKETPGVSDCNDQQVNISEGGEHKKESLPPTPHNQRYVEEMEEDQNQQVVSPSDDDPSVPPGFGAFVKSDQQFDGIADDDDPDVPPGFG